METFPKVSSVKHVFHKYQILVLFSMKLNKIKAAQNQVQEMRKLSLM